MFNYTSTAEVPHPLLLALLTQSPGKVTVVSNHQILRLFKITVQTAYNWRIRGFLKGYKCCGKIYYRYDDIALLLFRRCGDNLPELMLAHFVLYGESATYVGHTEAELKKFISNKLFSSLWDSNGEFWCPFTTEVPWKCSAL